MLAEYATHFVYKLGGVHSAPDALAHILALNAVGKPQLLLEAVHQDQNESIDQDFLHFKDLVSNSTFEFSFNRGLLIKLVQDSSPIVIPGDARQLRQIILEKLHTSPLGGYLGYHKLLELARTRFWQLHLNSSVQEFCHQYILYKQTKVVTQKLLGLLQPLEIPLRSFEQGTMDLIIHLPESKGYDAIFTIVDRLYKYLTFIPYLTASTVLEPSQIVL